MNSRIKRIFALVVCAMVVVSTVTITTQATAVKLNKKTASIVVSKSIQLKINSKKKVKWTTSNKKVATVSKKGLVKGKKVGKATITAQVGKKKYKCVVTVKMGLNETKKDLYVGSTTTLKLLGASKKVKWSSSNKSVATVSTKGKVIGVKEGTATITAKYGKKKFKCKVRVTKVPANNVDTKPTEKPTEKPIEQPTEKPIEQPTDEPDRLTPEESGSGDNVEWGELY